MSNPAFRAALVMALAVCAATAASAGLTSTATAASDGPTTTVTTAPAGPTAAGMAAPARLTPTSRASRVWVSGQGADAYGCGPAPYPCRTLQYAYDHAAMTGGTILVHDPSTYGPLAIDHSISVVNDGAGAALVAAAGGDGVSIATGPGDFVSLEGLTIDGGGAVGNGVTVSSSTTLSISKCTIRGFVKGPDTPLTSGPFIGMTASFVTGNGVLVMAIGGGSLFSVVDTAILANAGNGVLVSSYKAVGEMTGQLVRVALTNNGGDGALAFALSTSINVLAEETRAIGNGAAGFEAKGITQSLVYLQRSSAWGNRSSAAQSGAGVVSSFGDNALLGGPSNGLPAAGAWMR